HLHERVPRRHLDDGARAAAGGAARARPAGRLWRAHPAPPGHGLRRGGRPAPHADARRPAAGVAAPAARADRGHPPAGTHGRLVPGGRAAAGLRAAMADITGSDLLAFLAQLDRVAEHRPWPRFPVDRTGWSVMIERLRAEDAWSLLGLWGEPGQVHLALRDEGNGEVGVLSLRCPDGRYPSVGSV